MPKTFAGLLRATLAEGKPAVGGAVLYEYGDADWSSRLRREGETPAEPRLAEDAAAGREPRPPVRLAPTAKARERGWERVSPSGLEGGTRIIGSKALAAKSSVALGIGTLFHAWLAEVAWLDDGLPSDEKLRRIAARLRGNSDISTGQIVTHLARLRGQLTAQAITEVLSRRFYDSPAKMGLKMKSWPKGAVEVVAQRERAFALQQEQKLMTGSIDRLVIVRSGGKPIAADVIDFKTDEIPPGDARALAEKVEFYRPQLEAYREVSAQLLQIDLKQVGGRIVFLNYGTVQSIT